MLRISLFSLGLKMKVEKLLQEKQVTITNQGMITIPAPFRKKYGLKDGDKILIVEDEGSLKIIPIKTEEELRKDSYTVKEMLDHLEISKAEELKREE